MKELVGKSISQLRKLLIDRQVRAREIADAHFYHLEKIEPDINAFISRTEDIAFRQADFVDGQLTSRNAADLPPLAGIPLALKDNICVAGHVTTCGSKILEKFVPPYSATAANRLLDSGALLLGKTNLDEFAMGSSTENSAFKITKNPWDPTRVPGGSSGGSAAAVSTGMTVIALGSDTGGSIRQPAGFCGVVGMKPTYGLVSRYGLVAYASSLDQIGPMGRSVEDVAITLEAIAGHDVYDSTSYDRRLPSFSTSLTQGVKDKRIGVIRELLGEGVDADVRTAVLDAIEVFKELGASVEEISMPLLRHSLSVYYLIATAEASANLARYDGVRYGHRETADDLLSMYFETRHAGFGAEVKRRIMLGTYALSSGYYDAYYKKAQQVRRLIKDDFDKEFKKFDILLSPVAPSVAFGVGEKTEDPLKMYLSDIATIPINLAGIPSISIPCGFGKGHMPIGLQILAAPLGDATTLSAAYAYEQVTEWHSSRSPFLNSVSSTTR